MIESHYIRRGMMVKSGTAEFRQEMSDTLKKSTTKKQAFLVKAHKIMEGSIEEQFRRIRIIIEI